MSTQQQYLNVQLQISVVPALKDQVIKNNKNTGS